MPPPPKVPSIALGGKQHLNWCCFFYPEGIRQKLLISFASSVAHSADDLASYILGRIEGQFCKG